KIKVISSSGISYKVVSFNVIVVPKVASPMMATFMGDTITEAGLTMVSELESGGKLIIERVVVEVEENGKKVRKSVPPLIVVAP
ncbi:MAG: hypothetical protein RLZZ337_1909, partial [Bacteroidota bacterium]